MSNPQAAAGLTDSLPPPLPTTTLSWDSHTQVVIQEITPHSYTLFTVIAITNVLSFSSLLLSMNGAVHTQIGCPVACWGGIEIALCHPHTIHYWQQFSSSETLLSADHDLLPFPVIILRSPPSLGEERLRHSLGVVQGIAMRFEV